MVEIYDIELPHYIADQFARLVIPGDGIGFAVAHDSGRKGVTCVAFGQTDRGPTATLSRAKDLYEVLKPNRVWQPDNEQLAWVDKTRRSRFYHNGFTGDNDTLDGQGYLVKWTDSFGTCTRLFICNPAYCDDQELKEFVDLLDKLLCGDGPWFYRPWHWLSTLLGAKEPLKIPKKELKEPKKEEIRP